MENEMRYIYAVYQHGSFSKAAEVLYLTQPALSTAVQKVENRIGMPLFDRTHKPLTLTPAGELYIQKYHEISHLEQELENQLGDISSVQTGNLRIGATAYFHSYVLSPVLKRYMEKYPGVSVKITESGADTLLEKISNHEIDLTFNCVTNPKDSFLRTPCFIDTILLAVPVDFPVNEELAGKAFSRDDIIQGKHESFDVPYVSLSTFSETPFILLTPGNDLYSRSLSFFDRARITPQVRMEVPQLATSFHLVQAGIGAAFICDRLVDTACENVLFYKFDAPSTTRVFDLVMSDRHYVSHAMHAFSDLFREHYDMKLPPRKR